MAGGLPRSVASVSPTGPAPTMMICVFKLDLRLLSLLLFYMYYELHCRSTRHDSAIPVTLVWNRFDLFPKQGGEQQAPGVMSQNFA